MRTFLFLQGPDGPFFSQLGARLRQEGCGVLRINFNGGDVFDWPWPKTVLFRGRPATWPAWVEDVARQHGITDLVLFGDCRPLHRAAMDQLRPALDVRIHVFEEGYVRPDWVTLERDGVNGHSLMCHDLGRLIREQSRIPHCEPTVIPIGSTTAARVRFCVQHHLAMLAVCWLFPHYRTHRLHPVRIEFIGWLRRGLRLCARRKTFTRRIESVLADTRPMFLLPLQLDRDAQIRFHSPFANMTALIEHVIGSFVRFAPSVARLVIKNHPLDNGVTDYSRIIARAAAEQGAADRICFHRRWTTPQPA